MKYYLISLALGAVLLLNSCSDDSNGPNNTNLSMVGSLSSTTVSSTNIKKDTPLANDIDEVKINSVRILISDIKMHVNGEGLTVKAGAAVFEANSNSQEFTFAVADIPNGSFNNVKYEFHRFSTSELPTYADDDVFKDFATSERYTIIIKGETVSGGISTPFTYNSSPVANLNFDFEPPVDVDDNSQIIINFEFDTEMVFMDKGELLDPNDTKNRPHIDNSIKDAIKANKK